MNLKESIKNVINKEFSKFFKNNSRSIFIDHEVDYYPWSNAYVSPHYLIKSTIVHVGDRKYVGTTFEDAASLALREENANKRLEKPESV